uniref:Uncharacterized protein n=2 Tax=viral metagenome TaxID=1070528 RepID=A0A6M3KN26_9ZZZZ
MPTMSKGITLLGAVYWRRKDGAHWQVGNAVRILNDAEGSIEVRDERGERVTLPNDSRFVKERTS